ncbi:MAG: DUF502 domain-containing protein [Pseudomonadota bacterium]
MRLKSGIQNAFKKYFLVGLIVTLPFFITVKFILFFTDYFDGILAVRDGRFLHFFPESLSPEKLFGFPVPFLGAALAIGFILLVGILSRNYLGRALIRWGDAAVSHIPGARVIYQLVKQITDTFMKHDQGRFTRVVMLQYPRPGIHTLAFVTGQSPASLQEKFDRRMLNVFVPTTPNPTSGFYLLVPETEVKNVDLTVEEAFKLIVSCGIASKDES